MERKEALQELLRNVEAEIIDGRYDPTFERAFYRLSGSMAAAYQSADAYEGSLDAAKALHEAVLPDWSVDEMGERAGGWRVTLGRYDGSVKKSYPCGMIRGNPARAWLIAIIKALIAMEDGV